MTSSRHRGAPAVARKVVSVPTQDGYKKSWREGGGGVKESLGEGHALLRLLFFPQLSSFLATAAPSCRVPRTAPSAAASPLRFLFTVFSFSLTPGSFVFFSSVRGGGGFSEKRRGGSVGRPQPGAASCLMPQSQAAPPSERRPQEPRFLCFFPPYLSPSPSLRKPLQREEYFFLVFSCVESSPCVCQFFLGKRSVRAFPSTVGFHIFFPTVAPSCLDVRLLVPRARAARSIVATILLLAHLTSFFLLYPGLLSFGLLFVLQSCGAGSILVHLGGRGMVAPGVFLLLSQQQPPRNWR